MLIRILREIETAQGTLNLDDLSRNLDVERSALEGMIEFWVRKGRLQDDNKAAEVLLSACGAGECGASCPGPQACPFVAKMPKTYSLNSRRKR